MGESASIDPPCANPTSSPLIVCFHSLLLPSAHCIFRRTQRSVSVVTQFSGLLTF